MQYQGLLVSVLLYEASKRDGIRGLQSAWAHVEAAGGRLVNKLDELYPTENPPCDGTILCLHEGGRGHKRDCPGKTVSILRYTKGLQ